MYHTSNTAVDAIALASDPSAPLDRKFQLLDRANWHEKDSIAWRICTSTPAQDLTTAQFRILLETGDGGNVGGFLDWTDQ